jgi:hypothetical protein
VWEGRECGGGGAEEGGGVEGGGRRGLGHGFVVISVELVGCVDCWIFEDNDNVLRLSRGPKLRSERLLFDSG